MRATGSKEIANRLVEGVDSLLAGGNCGKKTGRRQETERWLVTDRQAASDTDRKHKGIPFGCHLEDFNSEYSAVGTLKGCGIIRGTIRKPPLLVQRCTGTTAALDYLEVYVICPCKAPPWPVV